MRILPFLGLLAAVAVGPSIAAAQDSARNVRVFFDCNANCDDDYIRLQTPWVDFVRDRADADVHLLITSLQTGAGGQRYTLAFLGLGRFAGRGDTLQFIVNVGDSDDAGRRGLTRTIQLGLAQYVARTPAASRIAMRAEETREGGAPRATQDDPWRSWVFDIDGFGGLFSEERRSEFEWGGSLEANRITSGWKFGLRSNAFFNESRFTLDHDTTTSDGRDTTIQRKITTIRESYSGGAVLVKSHGPHWGSGIQATAGASTFANTKLALRAAPAIEFSFFPYDEFTNRQLVLQYSLGVSHFEYREETVFGKMSETRPTHALVLGYDLTQPWGEMDVTLETSRYLDNGSQWRLSANGELELRITRGFSVDFSAHASLIRDQLSIAKSEFSDEDILLGLRELRSDYRYNAFISLSYTFGSIFSAVVNPRFGTGPGEILR